VFARDDVFKGVERRVKCRLQEGCRSGGEKGYTEIVPHSISLTSYTLSFHLQLFFCMLPTTSPILTTPCNSNFIPNAGEKKNATNE